MGTGKELAAIVELGCRDWYGGENTEDPLFLGSVMIWSTSYLKWFDTFLDGLEIDTSGL